MTNERLVKATRKRVNPTNPEVEGYDFSGATLYVTQNEAGSYRCVADLDDSQPVLEPTMVCGKWGEVNVIGVKTAEGEVHGLIPDENMPLRVMLAPAVETEGDQEVAQAA